MTELVAQIVDSSETGTKIMKLTGEMDESSIPVMESALQPLFDDASVVNLVLDMKELAFINSKGIGYLVSVQTHLAKDKRKVYMVAASQEVMDVISLVGLTTIIPYFETMEEAEAAIA